LWEEGVNGGDEGVESIGFIYRKEIELRQARIRENLGLRPLPDSP
jgi:hypothetical protein